MGQQGKRMLGTEDILVVWRRQRVAELRTLLGQHGYYLDYHAATHRFTVSSPTECILRQATEQAVEKVVLELLDPRDAQRGENKQAINAPFQRKEGKRAAYREIHR